MPIKDFQGRGRIPRLGKIRLGIKKKGTKSEYPSAVDYFVCPIEVRAVYGDKPKKLNIAFHSDELEEVFPQYYKRYGRSTGLVCKGDGEIANQINPETGEFEEVGCNGRDCDYWKENNCKAIGNLCFMIQGVNRFGVYQLDTSSYNSILNINGGIEYAKKLTGGRLAVLPFILEVIPQEASPEGKKITIYVLRLEADISKMMKALDSKPQDLFLPVQLEKDIEEDLHEKGLVDSIKKPTISQLRDMYIKADKVGYNRLAFVEYLKKNYKIKKSSKELTMEQFNEIMKFLETKLSGREEEEKKLDDDFEKSEGKLKV